MKEIDAEIGSIVFSKSGRDSGRYYIIVKIIDDNYVAICDGDLRRLSKPKVKKKKHIAIKRDKIESVAEKLKSGKQVFDSEIKSQLRQYIDKLEAK